ncbi:nitronate monooxygenase [Aeromicrobium alkaliterrae]
MLLPALRHPVVGAPMAGGVSTPALVAAVGEAGGLGQLAAGYLDVPTVAEQVAAVRSTTTAPFVVNVFVAETLDEATEGPAVAEFARRLAPVAERLGAEVPHPRWDDTDHYAEKVDLLADLAVPVVSFTFGCPSAADVDRLHAVGTVVVVTVTTPGEAAAAAAVEADALCVQGHEAGGHRGVWDRRAEPSPLTHLDLLPLVRAVSDLPLVAAGAIASADDTRAALAAGAVAVQVGTALLLADEAGTRPAHRRALAESGRRSTTTRSFSGRVGRGLTNTWTRELGDAPATFPVVDQLTKPLRAAAGRADDAEHVNLWAGTAWRDARPGPAGDVVRRLSPVRVDLS